MPAPSRREFLSGAVSFGAASALVLPAHAQPTPRALDAAEAEKILAELGPPPESSIMSDRDLARTAPNPLGPFYRAGAPFRGKISRPFSPGPVLIVSGRVWGHDTRRPLAGAVFDIWQVDNATRLYSPGGGAAGEGGDYANRARIVCSESGYYEFETVHPVWYHPNPSDPSFVRSPHIHFIATYPGYTRLVSEMFFEGDEKQADDPMFKTELRVRVVREGAEAPIEQAMFDIVLARTGT